METIERNVSQRFSPRVVKANLCNELAKKRTGSKRRNATEKGGGIDGKVIGWLHPTYNVITIPIIIVIIIVTMIARTTRVPIM